MDKRYGLMTLNHKICSNLNIGMTPSRRSMVISGGWIFYHGIGSSRTNPTLGWVWGPNVGPKLSLRLYWVA